MTIFFLNLVIVQRLKNGSALKGKIRIFFKCIYYKAYSMAEIFPI